MLPETQENIIPLYEKMKLGVPYLQTVINCCKALNMSYDETVDFLKEKNITLRPNMEYEELLAELSKN